MILNTLPNEHFWLGFKFNKGEIKLKSVKCRCSNINLKKVNFIFHIKSIKIKVTRINKVTRTISEIKKIPNEHAKKNL